MQTFRMFEHTVKRHFIALLAALLPLRQACSGGPSMVSASDSKQAHSPFGNHMDFTTSPTTSPLHTPTSHLGQFGLTTPTTPAHQLTTPTTTTTPTTPTTPVTATTTGVRRTHRQRTASSRKSSEYSESDETDPEDEKPQKKRSKSTPASASSSAKKKAKKTDSPQTPEPTKHSNPTPTQPHHTQTPNQDQSSKGESTKESEAATTTTTTPAAEPDPIETKECCICLDVMDSDICVTPCNHEFHYDCISTFLSNGNKNPSCPLCNRRCTQRQLIQLNPKPNSGRSTGLDPALAPFVNVCNRVKLDFILKKLVEIRTADATAKSLIFTQFMTTLNWLKEELKNAGYKYRTLTGSMSVAARRKALHEFQNDPPTTVFILSVRAGAVGINLTQANHVFLMDPALNRALEAQAVGRVHRMGQEREVHIHKLIMQNTIEERILEVTQEPTSSTEIDEILVGNLIKENARAIKEDQLRRLFQ